MIEKLKRLLEEAVKMLYETDYDLIRSGYERAIVPHIFCNIKELIKNNSEYAEFRYYNVDNEYERHGENEKRIDPDKCARPDIILHKRGTDDFNLMIAEFKIIRNNNNRNNDSINEYDLEKLKKFTSPNRNAEICYNYQLGVSVVLETSKIRFIYIQNGEETDQRTELISF